MSVNDFITADRPLYRSITDKKLTGVCGGIAKRYDLDPSMVRLGFVVTTIIGCIGLPLYVVAALVVPKERLI